VFDSHLKSTGHDYTVTVALLAVAFIFSPAVLLSSRPIGYWSFSFAAVCSASSVIWAWIHWKRSSRLSMPSIATPVLTGKN
jgi:hypothetical protein